MRRAKWLVAGAALIGIGLGRELLERPPIPHSLLGDLFDLGRTLEGRVIHEQIDRTRSLVDLDRRNADDALSADNRLERHHDGTVHIPETVTVLPSL
jgi:hypothetical protein